MLTKHVKKIKVTSKRREANVEVLNYWQGREKKKLDEERKGLGEGEA